MSTQISKSLIALFFLGMFVTGCNTNTKQTADNDIKFDSIRVDRTYHLLNNPDNPNCNLQLNFTYPAKFSDKEILKKIQNDFVLSYFGENYENLSPEEAVAKYTEDYLNNYKELEADFKAELEKKLKSGNADEARAVLKIIFENVQKGLTEFIEKINDIEDPQTKEKFITVTSKWLRQASDDL